VESKLETLCQIYAWLGLAVLGGILTGGLGMIRPGLLRPLWPPQRLRALSWSGWDVAIVFFLTWALVPALVVSVLTDTGFFRWYYGPDFPVTALSSPDVPGDQFAANRRELWITALSGPLVILAILLFLFLVRGVRLYQLGLTRRHGARNAVLGYGTWLYLSPCVFALNYLVEHLNARWGSGPPEMHPFFQLTHGAAGPPTRLEWALVFVTAIVTAPVLEELIFRGVIQPWLTRRSWGGDAAIAAAFAVALVSHYSKLWNAYHLDETRARLQALWEGLAPALFVLAMVPGYMAIERLMWPWLPYPGMARAIYGTALLFAAFHSVVWPSPVPLFLLALGLGFLAFRTQSLVAPITLHAMFNGVSTLTLVFLALAEPQAEKGKETTSAERGPSSAATSSLVPGESWPRRAYPSASIASPRGELVEEVIRPTSLPSWCKRVPGEIGAVPDTRKPRNDQLTWPKSRLRTIGS
jgi:membrane protease YdiL (CAAX protease family)